MEEHVEGGRNTYGEIIGILMQERLFPRIPGDIGNASTFNFPVRMQMIRGVDISTRFKLFEGNESLIQPFIHGAKALEEAGVRAITSCCGFLILFQDIIAEAVNVPVFMSSLMLIPIVHRMLKKGQSIGVITSNATDKGLGKRHYQAAGAGDIPIETIGMEGSNAWETIAKDKTVLNPEQVKQDLIDRAQLLIEKNPTIGALVLECANMPPYAKAIQDRVNLPVFDIVTFINFVYSAVVQRKYKGYL
ncbi:MAG: aspartate/glutamate racemase family protein [Deltaproteobacteria bacterium]|nr:aspartate/glutamate racemase family protein [Deltaproteobacteria bacterium]